MELHELTAAYALDALDASERGSYEAHLASCEGCREELQGFRKVTGSLARAAGGSRPPAGLRDRILEQARSERPNVVPLRRRFAVPVLSSAAAVAAVAALALGLWGASVSGELDDAKEITSVLGHPSARTYDTETGEASLVVTPTGRAVLVVRNLAAAPEGKDYEIWVAEGRVMHRAGIFEKPGAAALTRRVAPGQSVAVTLERDGGVDVPTSDPLFITSSV
ncbi:MAG: anti-sigma factor [Gaiellaceae bacterium]